MAWLNLPHLRLARCNTCRGHVHRSWPKKAAHDDEHHQARIAAAVTPEVIAAERERRKYNLHNHNEGERS